MARPGVNLPFVWIAGATCGVVWWAISTALGATSYGVLGTHALTGVMAGACAGILMATLSVAVYRRVSLRGLLLYSAVSAYLAIAVYGVFIFLIRSATNDFRTGQIPWAVGMQSVLGMWWGITLLAPIAMLVQLLAYGNHRLLRRSFIAGSRTPQGPGSDRR